MLDGALVNSLFHDLENAVFYYGVSIDKACPRGDNFGDKGIGAKGICDEIASPIDQRPTDYMKGCEEHCITVTNVGKRYRVVITPRRETSRQFYGRRDSRHA